MTTQSCLRSLFHSVVLVCTVTLLFANHGFAQQSLPTHHLRPAVANGQATKLGTLPETAQMRVGIMLPIRDQGGLNLLLQRQRDPSSPDYRNFLTAEQFTDQFGATAEDYQAVIDFAQANGLTVTGTYKNRLLIDVTGSVAQIEKAFNISMGLYRHPTENRTFFAPDREPTVNLGVPLWAIAGLDNYSVPRPQTRMPKQGDPIVNATGSAGGNFLPSDMRAAYYGNGPLTGSGQTLALVEFDSYYINDLVETFNQGSLTGIASATQNGNNYTLTYNAAGGPYTIPINNVLLDNASLTPVTTCPYSPYWSCDPQGSETEVVLDIAQAIGMAPGLAQVMVYIAPLSTEPVYGGTGDYDLFYRIAQDDIAAQMSLSWSWEPPDPGQLDPVFQQLGSQGQSLFVASGDYGSYSSGSNSEAPGACYYGLCGQYPQEDAYVIAVGGTALTTNGAGGSWAGESAWSYSGGGPSPDGILIPGYQSALNGVNGASTTLRNVPDVAAEANFDNYYCGFGSCGGGLGGTSFAAPRWAGFMALVNQQAVAAGVLRPNTIGLGFVNATNPGVYTIGGGSNYNSDFHDIQSGSNGAYYAGYDYDLVTGWGSPNGQSLINDMTEPTQHPIYSPTSVSCIAVNGKGGYVTNPAGPETQNGGQAEMRTIIQNLRGTLLDAQCTWSGFPSIVTTQNMTLSVPVNYQQQDGSSAVLNGTDFTSSYYGTVQVAVPSGTNLSTISVTGEAIASGGLGNNSDLYVGWINIQ